MNAIISELAITASQSIEILVLLKVTLFFAVGLAIVGLAGRVKASWRHLVLTTTFAAVLLLPIVTLLVPSIAVSLASDRSGPVTEQSAAMTRTASGNPVLTGVSQVAVSRGTSWSAPTLTEVLPGVWFLGVFLVISALAIDLWRVRILRRNGLPSPELSELTMRIADEAGLERPIEVLLHEDVKSPVTFGFLRPVIMMSPDSVDWESIDIHRALVHELEHVKRGDWATQLAARVACAFYWFHPLAWIAMRKFSLEAERACDDAVVQNAENTEYAEQLVTLSKELSKARAYPILGMAKRSDLSKRVSALLDSSQPRGSTGFLAAVCALVLGGLAVVSIGPLRAVAQSTTSLLRTGMNNSYAQECTPLDRALFSAAEEGESDQIESLVNAGANINCALSGDGTPLIVAARNDHLETVRALLDRGADVNMAVQGDGNPLIAAAKEGNRRIVKLLLDRGADVNRSFPDDENALISASGEGHLDTVKLLVGNGANINARFEVEVGYITGETEWRSALSAAKKGEHAEVVAYLKASGAQE